MTSPAPFILAGSIATRRHSLADRLAFALGLSAGAVGTSFVAQVGNAEAPRPPHMKMLPEHYELMENGVAVFKLETGEDLSLTSDQYLIMDDGLLLITDELAQAWVYSLPVMGSVRAQLLSDLAPVATIDGTVAEATPQQTLAITQGTATRLSEQVDLQSYELAQASDGSSSEVREAVALGLSVSPGAMALLGMLMTSDQPEGETEVEETPAPPAPPPEPEFLSNAMFQALTPTNARAFTGSARDSFIGYTAASTAAAASALTDVGRFFGNTATFDMSAGGNNTFVAGDRAASSSGSIAYTGGSGDDSLTFGDSLAENGNATFDMSAGGDNFFVAGTDAAQSGGSLAYTGGSGDDSLTFGINLASAGSATFDMSAGGNNTFVAENSAGDGDDSAGSLAYTGGSGDDSLTFGSRLAQGSVAVTFDMSAGGNNTFVANNQAALSSSLTYTGGSGDDSLTFGISLARSGGNATFDMSEGGSNTFVAGSSAILGNGSIVYKGGTGDDSLTFGSNSLEGIATFDMTAGGANRLTAGRDAGSGGGTLTYSGGSGPDELRFGDNAALDGSFSLDLGGDSATDTVAFEGYVGVAGGDGGVQIQNFNVFDDLLTVARSFSVLTDSSPQGTITGIEMADQYGTINFNGLTGVSYTDFVAAITIS